MKRRWPPKEPRPPAPPAPRPGRRSVLDQPVACVGRLESPQQDPCCVPDRRPSCRALGVVPRSRLARVVPVSNYSAARILAIDAIDTHLATDASLVVVRPGLPRLHRSPVHHHSPYAIHASRARNGRSAGTAAAAAPPRRMESAPDAATGYWLHRVFGSSRTQTPNWLCLRSLCPELRGLPRPSARKPALR